MKKVLLYHPLNAPEGKPFDRGHADRLLAMTDNGGWYENSEQEENSDNASNGNSNKAKTRGTAKKKRNSSGNQSPTAG